MIVKRITEIDEQLGRELLDLMSTIDDDEMDIEAFARYFVASLDTIGVFGAFDDGKLVCVVYAEEPTEIYPNRAYLYITASYPTTPQSVSRQVFDMATEWAKSKGATYWWGWTQRSPRAINRLYGFEVVKEKQVVCPITGDDHLRIPRDERYRR